MKPQMDFVATKMQYHCNGLIMPREWFSRFSELVTPLKLQRREVDHSIWQLQFEVEKYFNCYADDIVNLTNGGQGFASLKLPQN